jgi:hypothetical protein
MSTPQADTSNRSNLFGELRIYQKQITAAATSAPSAIMSSIVGAMSDVIYDLEQVVQGRAEATRILSDQRLSSVEQYRQASAVMSKAFAACASSTAALESAAASARAALEKSLLPKAPKGVEEVTILDRKQDLSLLLANTQGTPDQKIKALSQQLRTAIQTSDDLTAFVLCSRMSFQYQANGLNPDTVAAVFSQVLGEPLDDNDRAPIAGALLLSNLTKGGYRPISSSSSGIAGSPWCATAERRRLIVRSGVGSSSALCRPPTRPSSFGVAVGLFVSGALEAVMNLSTDG